MSFIVCGKKPFFIFMAITRVKKEEIISKLSKLFKKAYLLVFLGFRGLSVAKASELRRKLRSVGASYIVAKKRLARLVLAQEGIDMPLVEGETAFVCSDVSTDSALAVAKELYAFTRAHKEAALLGGVYEQRIIAAETIVKLAKIPPREVLIAQLLGVLQGSMRGLVGVLNGPQRGLVTVLKQIGDRK